MSSYKDLTEIAAARASNKAFKRQEWVNVADEWVPKLLDFVAAVSKAASNEDATASQTNKALSEALKNLK